MRLSVGPPRLPDGHPLRTSDAGDDHGAVSALIGARSRAQSSFLGLAKQSRRDVSLGRVRPATPDAQPARRALIAERVLRPPRLVPENAVSLAINAVAPLWRPLWEELAEIVRLASRVIAVVAG